MNHRADDPRVVTPRNPQPVAEPGTGRVAIGQGFRPGGIRPPKIATSSKAPP